MLVAALIALGLGVLLTAHVTVLPLIHGRAVLFYGTESVLATVSLMVAVVLFVATAVDRAALVVAIAGIAVVALGVLALSRLLRPWLAFGVGADVVFAGAQRAAGMVRARFEPSEASAAVVGGAARLRVFGLLPGVTLVILTGTASPKVALWRNLFRKNIQNHSWRVA